MDSAQAEKLRRVAMEMAPFVTDVRRKLHVHPELRWEETWTLDFIRKMVEAVIEDTRAPMAIHEAKGGIFIDFTFDKTTNRLLFRADVDGLPIEEKTGLPFASEIPGKMHACGHDCHTAMLLGAMIATAKGKVRPMHNIRFVFQRAEENPITPSGGDILVNEEGVCEGVESVHGLHVWATGKTGVFRGRPGAALANSDRIQIKITCEGGHVARPFDGSNAIDIAMDIQNALRGLDTRFFHPTEPRSFVPAMFNSGTSSNIRPATAELWFACRNVLPEDRRMEFKKIVEERVLSVVAGYPDSMAVYNYVKGHPALINTPEDIDRVGALLRDSGEEVEEAGLEMGGEDFAHYLRKCPGSFWMLGAHKDGASDHHTPHFDINESILWKGVLYWLLLATT